ncbi:MULTISPECIES: Panacea domain-containing protein [Butyricimonas]|uniref:Panacea domain-containing protein n=1 Tax=Butyricimonas TaxID=574697 RepID=UPI0007FB569A|nr:MULTISPECIES: Panacea domain-containing protein [Butyricimonas]
MKEKDLLKIKAVLLYLLKKFGKEVDYIKIFKLLYLAQKEHLKLFGLPLFKDDFYAFVAGPAPSVTYNICKVAEGSLHEPDLDLIAASIHVQEKKIGNNRIKYVSALEEPEMIRLSKSNIKVLDIIFDKYHSYYSSRLSNITHNDNAWKYAREKGNGKVEKMPLTEIAKTANIPQEMMEYVNEMIMMNGMA